MVRPALRYYCHRHKHLQLPPIFYMNPQAPTPLKSSKPASYLKTGFVALLAAYVAMVTYQEVLPYFILEKESYGRFWDFRFALAFHIACGLVAMVIGPFQFSKAFRSKYLRIHRLLGRLYLLAILVGALSATQLAWTSGYRVSFGWAFGLQVLALAWIVTAGMAFWKVKNGHILQHKEWMIRSYVVTLGFFFFRIINNAAFAKAIMPEFKERGVTIIWLCWAVPLLATEVVLSWKKK